MKTTSLCMAGLATAALLYSVAPGFASADDDDDLLGLLVSKKSSAKRRRSA
ncbi:MAG: hypothetical protein ACFUZC_08245 [Chthoniobacteraceae bacterium]